jgi:hypothetical protein
LNVLTPPPTAGLLLLAIAQPPIESKQRPYHDLEVVQELNAMQRAATKAAARAARVADDSKKW